MSEIMEAEVEVLSLPSAASASTLEQKQDGKDLYNEMLVIKEEFPHECRSILDQQHPVPPHIKEEEEELCIDQEVEQLIVKIEEEEKPQFSERIKFEDCRETDDPTRSSAEQMETQPNGQDSDRNSDSLCPLQKSKITVHKRGKRTKLSSKLTAPIRLYSGERPFGCNVCGKRFKTKTHVKLHMMIHTGIREHSCDLCGKGFKEKHCLQIHMRLHTGERPFACDDCGRRFHAKTNLKTHLKVHSQEKTFFL
ncbi:zinc finger and SCAN domain-containing protein 12-like [Cyprinodon tularosa]|uniref:zinc finger and SCAN domain-containing protein 12-like n=1 Tax=Cyprinodon tularosa TaxID=77115 RepID=UPI0018E22254|nr:zinc finger and SCAN domain-containing protein 12-like [Cyprinodon tularosa]